LTRPPLPIQPRHLLPGLAAFVAAVLVALLGLALALRRTNLFSVVKLGDAN
jgi:hypothetical protein